MKIKIKAFASVREAFGFEEKELTVSEGITVKDIMHQLKKSYPPLDNFNGSLLYRHKRGILPRNRRPL